MKSELSKEERRGRVGEVEFQMQVRMQQCDIGNLANSICGGVVG